MIHSKYLSLPNKLTIFALAVVLALPAWGARSFNGSNQAISRTDAVWNTSPFTISAWFRSTSDSTAQNVFCLGRSGVNNSSIQLIIRGDQPGDIVQLIMNDGSNQGAAASTGGYTANAWHHIAGVAVSTSSRFVYLDGVQSTENTTTVASPFALDRTDIARRTLNGTQGTYFAGDVGEVTIWSVALSSSEIVSLAHGFSPLLVRPSALVFHAPLWREIADQIGGLALTNNGSTEATTHPRLYR